MTTNDRHTDQAGYFAGRREGHASDLSPELDARTLTALRQLDAADTALTTEQRMRKDELLHRLLADEGHAATGASRTTAGTHGSTSATGSTSASVTTTDTHATAEPTVVPLASRRGRSVRRALIPAAAAAVLAGALITVNAINGSEPAYATWTRTAQTAPASIRTAAEEACRGTVVEAAQPETDPDIPADLQPAVQADTARTVLSEVRGEYVLTVMVTDDGSSFECFSTTRNPGRLQAASGSTTTVSSPPLEPIDATEVELPGAGMTSGPEGALAFTTGRVGEDVAGVTLHTEGETIEASVSDGWVSAWWPMREEPVGGNVPSVRVDVTLKDGTVLQAAPTDLAAPEIGAEQIGDIGTGGGAGDDGFSSLSTGRVGADVVGVTVHTPSGPVDAEVGGGSFLAEWPTDESGSEEAISFDVTLRDGRVLEDVTPVEGE